MSASEQPPLGMFHLFPEQSPSTALFQALSSHEALEPATNIPAARLTYNQRQKQEKFYCQMCRDIAAEKPDIQTQDYMTNIKLDKVNSHARRLAQLEYERDLVSLIQPSKELLEAMVPRLLPWLYSKHLAPFVLSLSQSLQDIETAVFVNARQYQRIMARRDRRCARERRGLVVKRPKLPLRATACDNQ
eukprot:TRINITY_DN12252_c0_g1_i3.p2 TRINITY_DN12252_c0_g1~~TRINITY_DN12252_c0_g1_i3.p2  ORF type:complete len:189 (+),score=25.55 TRINITY_DN12252_c0_g1_i3:106-672(+)